VYWAIYISDFRILRLIYSAFSHPKQQELDVISRHFTFNTLALPSHIATVCNWHGSSTRTLQPSTSENTMKKPVL
jgi:hypothetical protein